MDAYLLIMASLPKHPAESKNGFWVNEDGCIMCRLKTQAYAMANFLEELGAREVNLAVYTDKIENPLYYGWYEVYPDFV